MIRYYLENPAFTFERATKGASGYDIRSARQDERVIEPGARCLVSTGLFLEMPEGIEAQLRSRSGLAINYGVIVLNAPGTVDSDYRGEVKVTLQNHGSQPYTIVPGERIAQLVFAPVFPECQVLPRLGLDPATWIQVVRVDSRELLGDTARGASGHGSTGR